LTADGEKRIRATGKALVGSDRLIVPNQVAHVYVSPRRRAQRTLELLNLDCHDPLPWVPRPPENPEVPGDPGDELRKKVKVQITEDIREWDYGDYEGVTSATIRKQRTERGEGPWDIWRDGCPGGESPEQITERLDRLIADIRKRWHDPAMQKKSDKPDVLIVAHGHILRAFAMRWIGREFASGVALLLEAGGVGTLSYEHHSIDEPAILLGGAFVVDVVESVKNEVMEERS